VALCTLPSLFLDISKESGQGALKITGSISTLPVWFLVLFKMNGSTSASL
jgi:hypothetical protein